MRETFGQMLARLRREHEPRLTLRALAKLANYNHVTVYKVEKGEQQPTREFAEAVDQALSAGGTLIARYEADKLPVPAMPLDGLAPDLDLLARIDFVLDGERPVDAATVGWLERCLAEHRLVEDSIGSRPLVTVVRAQLDVVARLISSSRGGLVDRAVSLAAQYAQFLGWMSLDMQQAGAARAWYERSHNWAAEAHDENLIANTFIMRAHSAWGDGDPRRCLEMAEAAQRFDDRVTPGVQGMSAQIMARAHAIVGDVDAARHAIDKAQELIALAAACRDREPAWMYYYDDIWFSLQRGMIEQALGRPVEATDLFTTGLSALQDAYPRDAVWFSACLARAQVDAGMVDAATATALHAAPAAVALNPYASAVLDQVRDAVRAAGAGRQAEEISEALRPRR